VKFQVPEKITSVSIDGETFTPDEDGLLDVDVRVHEHARQHLEAIGAVHVTGKDDASFKVRGQKADDAEKAALIKRAQEEHGVVIDGRKSLDAVRAQVKNLDERKAQKA
jgi:hypothetical protein